MDALFIGFGFRIFCWLLDPIPETVKAICLGVWEGLTLFRAAPEQDISPYLTCALHLLFDFLFGGSLHSMITIILSLVLAFLCSDMLGSHDAHDTIRRTDSTRTHVARTTKVHDVPHSHRANRLRLVEVPRDPSVRPRNETSVTRIIPSGDSSPQVVILHDTPFPRAVNTLTPPCTPPEPGPSHFPGALANERYIPETHDELQTPSSLATPRALSYTPYLDDNLPEEEDHRDQDELQTPLPLELHSLPLVGVDAAFEERDQLLFPEDSASVAREDNASELSLRSGTALSTISGIDALLIAAKAERLRNEAWEEEKQQGLLAAQLRDAESRHKIKDAFLLKREILACNQRAQKLHDRAARRYIKARNLANKRGVVDVHNLFVPEAVKVVESSLEAAILNSHQELQVIVGRGLHSKDRQPKLGPAITREMQKHGIQCHVHPRNPGVLILTVPT